MYKRQPQKWGEDKIRTGQGGLGRRPGLCGLMGTDPRWQAGQLVPGLRFQLGAEPESAALAKHVCWGAPHARKERGSLWVPHLRRWMVPLELAAASGFPATPPFGAGSTAPRGSDSLPGKKSQVGNVMQLPNVGCVLATALATLAPMWTKKNARTVLLS